MMSSAGPLRALQARREADEAATALATYERSVSISRRWYVDDFIRDGLVVVENVSESRPGMK